MRILFFFPHNHEDTEIGAFCLHFTALGQVLGPNLVTRLPVTFGSKQVKRSGEHCVRLPHPQWPKVGRAGAK